MPPKSFLVSVLIIFLFSACTPSITQMPATGTVTAAISPLPTLPTSTETSIPPQIVKLTQDAGLYSGPGNADFTQLDFMKAGTPVQPLESYQDFVLVKTNDSGNKSGYIWKGALDEIPSGLLEESAETVPWQPLFQPECSPAIFDFSSDKAEFPNTGDGYSDTESAAITLTAPLRVAMSAVAIQGGQSAAIKILGIPEPTSGDWWKGITRLDIGFADGGYYVGIRDGSQADYNFSIPITIKADQPVQLIFDQVEGKSFNILDGQGKVIRSVDLTTIAALNLPDGLFPQGKVYLGTTVPPKSTFTVTGLRIGVLPAGKWVQAQNGYYTQPGLATLAAARHITIGTEFYLGGTADPRYCNIMQRDFNLAVLSEFSSPDLWLGPGQYDFSALDRAVDYATQRGWKIRASHLLWGNPDALPGWLKTSHYTREEYIQIMEQFIADVVTRYSGKVQEWSIANEATNRSFSPGADFWNDKIGPEYIALAFRAARKADPQGILIFNEDNNQAPQDAGTTRVINKMYATVKQLKAEGVPIDEVGMQMHLFLPWNSAIRPNKQDVIATMQKFAALGVHVEITEFDVDMAHQKGTQAEKWAEEADIYRDMMEACLESTVCDSFSTWEFADVNSWITCTDSWCVNDAGADPLLFDVNYDPKPAYFAVRDALLSDFYLVPTPIK